MAVLARLAPSSGRLFPRPLDRVARDRPITNGLCALIVPASDGFVDLIDGYKLAMTGGWTSSVIQGAPALVHDGVSTTRAESNAARHLIGSGDLTNCTVVAGFSASTTGVAKAICGSSNTVVDTRISCLTEVYNDTNNIGWGANSGGGDWDSGLPLLNAERMIAAYTYTPSQGGAFTRQGAATTAWTDAPGTVVQFTIGSIFRYGSGWIDQMASGDAVFFVAIFKRVLTTGEVRALIDNPRLLSISPIEFLPNLNSAQTAAAGGGSSVTLEPFAGNVAWNGKLATLKTLYKANPAVGNIAWNGKLATIKTLIKLGPSAGNVAWNGGLPTLKTVYKASPSVGTLNWNGGAATLKTLYRVSPLAGLVQWNGKLPTIDSKILVTLSPYAGALSWNGGLPTAKTVYKISPAAGAINWNGGLPTVSFPTSFAWTAVSRASTSWNAVARDTQTWTRIQRDGSTFWTTRERPYDEEV